jgi:hypothetical protein
MSEHSVINLSEVFFDKIKSMEYVNSVIIHANLETTIEKIKMTSMTSDVHHL